MYVNVVTNCGRLIRAFLDEDEARGYAEDLTERGIKQEIMESGRDEEDLTPEEYGEFAFANSYNGGFYSVAGVELNEEEDSVIDRDEEVTTDDGDTFTAGEILDVLVTDEEEEDVLLFE